MNMVNLNKRSSTKANPRDTVLRGATPFMKKSESAVYPSDDSSALKFVAATAL